MTSTRGYHPRLFSTRMKLKLRTVFWLVAIGGIGVAIWRALQPTPVIVDAAEVRRGEIVVTVEDDGRTRVRDRYTVHAPVRGVLLRTPLRAGDAVRTGETIVATLAPSRVTQLDERGRAEAEARLARARAAVDESHARAAQAEAAAAFAESELTRIAETVRSGIAPSTAEDAARTEARVRREAARAAGFARRVAEFEVELAAAALREDALVTTEARNGTGDAAPRDVVLRSPIDGVVLRVAIDSERAIEAGTPLLELGDLRALEFVADFLTQDTVDVRSGQPARITGWGGRDAGASSREFAAVVRRVEPSGFTKISALGVEEQRVDVVLDPAGDEASWSALGDGFRVDVRIEIARAADLLVVPTGALFRSRGTDAVWVVAPDGFARLRTISIGRQAGVLAEVTAGLVAGEHVVLHPSALVDEGVPLTIR